MSPPVNLGLPPAAKATKAAKPPPTPPVNAGIPTTGLKEMVPNEEHSLHLPHHQFQWKDALENDRITLVVFLPTGCTKDDVVPHIFSNMI